MSPLSFLTTYMTYPNPSLLCDGQLLAPPLSLAIYNRYDQPHCLMWLDSTPTKLSSNHNKGLSINNL